MAQYDFAFPAVDRNVVNQLQGQTGIPQVSNIIQNIENSEKMDLLTNLNAADANSQQALTYGLYLSRNKTIADVATKMTEDNKRLQGGAKDTYTRQAEINEWQAQNKFDTLFFLQSLFLFLCFITFILFLRQYGILTGGLFTFTAVFSFVILLGILWNRLSYTAFSRDKRYWNRRMIGLEDSSLRAKLQCQS